MDLGVTERVATLLNAVREMIENDIAPLDREYHAEVGKHPSGNRFAMTDRQLEIIDGLKALARKRNLWNFWLTGSDRGYGLSTVEYAYLAEEMGKVPLAAEVFNCSAPDTGNMEVLERYGTQLHKDRWLGDLLAGRIQASRAPCWVPMGVHEWTREMDFHPLLIIHAKTLRDHLHRVVAPHFGVPYFS